MRMAALSRWCRVSALVGFLLLSGCGFRPLYGDPQTAESLATVDLAAMPEKDGQTLRLLLADRFYGARPPVTPPGWTLAVTLTTSKQSLGIRRDDTATRARLMIKAVVILRKVGADAPVLTTTERSFVSYNILTDPYATLAAEDNALERGLTQLADTITQRVALTLAASPVPQGTP